MHAMYDPEVFRTPKDPDNHVCDLTEHDLRESTGQFRG